MRELEALLALDDTKLKASLECYQHLNSVRRGPYRAVQLVSILIFVIHCPTEGPELKDPKLKKDMKQSALIQMAWTATFICMGRLLDRCLTDNLLDFNSLLPAVLVFIEWLVGMLDKAEAYCADEKVTCAMSYFFGAFAELLNRLDNNEDEVESVYHTALWEEYKLRGFAPVAQSHLPLDFTIHGDCMDNFDSMNVCRVHRIFHAAMKLVARSNGSQKWIFYDKLGRKFYTAESVKFQDQGETKVAACSYSHEGKQPHQHKCGTTKENEEEVNGKHQKQPSTNVESLNVEDEEHKCGTTKENEEEVNGKHQKQPSTNVESLNVEDEEVILFKPLTRYNSEPLHTYITTNDQSSTEGTKEHAAPSDECLRRATSLLIAQNQLQTDPFNFHSNTSNVRFNKPLKQQEPILKDSATYPAGPPSLSGWVFNSGQNLEREKGTMDYNKHLLSPIEEVPSASLNALSISEAKDNATGSGHVSPITRNNSSPYVAPVPSAPLLPDEAVWFRSNSSFSESKNTVGIKEADGILGASPVGGYSNLSVAHRPFDSGPAVPGFIGGYPPIFGMSSSEWLYQYANNRNHELVNNHVQPVQVNPPGHIGNFNGHDTSRFDLFNRWGNPLVSSRMVYLESPESHPGLPPVYHLEELNRDKLFLGYQRQSPYGCGTGPAGIDLEAEQPHLLQYLKEREWQLQRDAQLRGPTYMGN
ncbi:unnamed protein product [Ilex paraguariensis]|uniref:DNA/RNA-binding domain-containing protein n=1 Tax=Ilex paraguariensis TaxID=185542 RepID=A0ABC8UL91_9AQUA